MNATVKQLSSLDKIYSINDFPKQDYNSANILLGEHFSYQIMIVQEDETLDNCAMIRVNIESPLSSYIKIHSVKYVPADFPHPKILDKGYDFSVPTMVPDLLVPIDMQKGYINTVNNMALFWVEVCVKDKEFAGSQEIKITLIGTSYDTDENEEIIEYERTAVMKLNIIPEKLPEQKIKFTQWFHVDCIADAHGEELYSERHWMLIDRYMKMASELGINMLLTPVITPPLDTRPGTCRPCTQLVRIEKKDKSYIFDFSLLKRYISLCKENGIKYYEISHFFSQWGCRFSPNIEIYENGEKKLMFGWHVCANSPAYKEFLQAFIPQLLDFLKGEDVLDKCYFHISDEPAEKHIHHYEYASNLLKPLFKECKIMDALSHIEFYEKGLVDCPVCTNDHIEPFIEKNVKGLWSYYCNGQREEVSNRLLAMPSYRNRIMGLQLYKYSIEGFLHWGYNFYYSQHSIYEINPYITTSADGCFSAGDAFSVYPGKNGPLPSMRAFVFREGLEDIEICRLLEKKIGKDAVIKIIEEEAGMELTFKQYPKNAEFIGNVMKKIKLMLLD